MLLLAVLPCNRKRRCRHNSPSSNSKRNTPPAPQASRQQWQQWRPVLVLVAAMVVLLHHQVRSV